MKDQFSTQSSTPPASSGLDGYPPSVTLPAHPGQSFSCPIASDEGRIIGRLNLSVDSIHIGVYEALKKGDFGFRAFFEEGLGITPQADIELHFFQLLADYCQNIIPLPDEDIWDAMVCGLLWGAA